MEGRGILLFVHVIEDDIEIPRQAIQDLKGVAHLEPRPAPHAALLEELAGLRHVLRRALGQDELPVLRQGPREPIRGITESRPQLQDPPRADALGQQAQGPSDEGPDDGKIPRLRSAFHLGKHGVSGGLQVLEIPLDMGEDDIAAPTARLHPISLRRSWTQRAPPFPE